LKFQGKLVVDFVHSTFSRAACYCKNIKKLDALYINSLALLSLQFSYSTINSTDISSNQASNLKLHEVLPESPILQRGSADKSTKYQL
jgi:hypothetical protein